MEGPRALDLALDLIRTPAFVSAMARSPLPSDVLDVIRVAAGSPEACRAAALATGQPESTLVEAARFYVQQILLRPDADCYRVLGLRPEDSRESARVHMRWLMEWLHPDHNQSWDAVYAKRIIKAWREVSTKLDTTANSYLTAERAEGPDRTKKRKRFSVRLPLIRQPVKSVAKTKKLYPRFVAAALLVAGLLAVFVFWD
jgi:hypothetical protein